MVREGPKAGIPCPPWEGTVGEGLGVMKLGTRGILHIFTSYFVIIT